MLFHSSTEGELGLRSVGSGGGISDSQDYSSQGHLWRLILPSSLILRLHSIAGHMASWKSRQLADMVWVCIPAQVSC